MTDLHMAEFAKRFDAEGMEMWHKIRDELEKIEQERGVKVLYACESGSRAWGFSSKDSDWDVRFIYVREPDWYFSCNIEHKRDVIEIPISDDLDISGWDLRKALILYRKSNPALFEWLRSPLIYLNHGHPVDDRAFSHCMTWDLPKECYSRTAAAYHYLHMAGGNYRQYLKGEEVWLKKYFYVLRPLLAVRWIEVNDDPVPMEFDKLLTILPENRYGDLVGDIKQLVADKRAGQEMGMAPKVDTITNFCRTELDAHGKGNFKFPGAKAPIEPLDDFLRAWSRGSFPTTMEKHNHA